MRNQLIKINELKKYSNYKWQEITIGCSDTKVYQLSNNKEILFLKVGKSGLLTNEYNNLQKVKKYLKVPKIVFYYNNNDNEILITSAMDGKMSCEDEFIDIFPKETIEVLCEAIKTIQLINVDQELQKDFNVYNIDQEINKIKKKISLGELIDIPDKNVFKKFSNLSEIVTYLENNKPKGDLCLSHGDVSMPNVFIVDGHLSGFIDVGNVGIRQKWYDIADLYVSIRRNFECEDIADEFLKKLGIKDKRPVEYYEMLINLS